MTLAKELETKLSDFIENNQHTFLPKSSKIVDSSGCKLITCNVNCFYDAVCIYTNDKKVFDIGMVRKGKKPVGKVRIYNFLLRN